MVSSDPWQICRVEDLLVNGVVRGSIIHIHRARTVIIESGGVISSSELGKECIPSNSVFISLSPSPFVSLVARVAWYCWFLGKGITSSFLVLTDRNPFRRLQ